MSAAAAVGVIAAAVLPGHRAGLGAVVIAWVAATTIVVVRARPGTSALTDASVAPSDPSAPAGDRAWAASCSALALGLASVPVVTDARWVVGWTAVAAFGLAGLAVAGGRTWRGVLGPVWRAVPAVGRVVTSVTAVARHWTHRAPARGRQLWTLAATVAVVVGFGALFASADVVFADLVDRFLVPEVAFGSLVGRTLMATSVLVLVCVVVVLRPRPDADTAIASPSSPLTGGEWRTPLLALVLLFAGFLVVQARSLFIDHATVLATSGITYAEAAREGFAQLLVVAFLTLVVVAIVGRYAAPRDVVDDRVRRGLLALLCLETVAVLASALQRLMLYEEAYGFTRDRIVAHATILWLGVVFGLVLLFGARRATRHLPRAVVLATGLSLLVFGAARPDAIVAQGNVARFAMTGDVDITLLTSLSADAAPAIAMLPDDLRACVADDTRAYRRDTVTGAEPDEGAWTAWNLARARAAALPPPAASARCVW